MEWKSVHAPVSGGEEAGLESGKAPPLTRGKDIDVERLGSESIHVPTSTGSEPKHTQSAVGNDARAEDEEPVSQLKKTPPTREIGDSADGIRPERADAGAGQDNLEALAEKEALS